MARTVYLPAYFEDSNNEPVTGATAVKFHFKTTDGIAGSSNLDMTAELGGRWYSYLYTDTLAKPIVYWATLSTYKNFPGGIVDLLNVMTSSGSRSVPNSLDEQYVVTFSFSSAGNRISFKNVKLDMTNITKDTVIKIKEKIDGTNLRVIDSMVWTPSMDPGVVIGGFYTTQDIGVYVQSLSLEGASRTISYRYTYEILS